MHRFSQVGGDVDIIVATQVLGRGLDVLIGGAAGEGAAGNA